MPDQESTINNQQSQEALPLVTFALVAYNQEKYIKEAVEGALAQTYSPLEIYISDDCSTDRTFEIIQELVKDYDGPNQVIINRNEQNLGLAGHVNHVFETTKGELIVMAAGDDISAPTRTRHLATKWLEFGRPSGVWSNYRNIDQGGLEHPCKNEHVTKVGRAMNLLPPSDQLTYAISLGYIPTVGATAAWNRAVFEDFEPFPNARLAEDIILSWRSILMGGLYYTHEITVNYRIHDNNTFSHSGIDWLSPKSIREGMKMKKRNLQLQYRSFLKLNEDLEDFSKDKSDTLYQEVKEFFKNKVRCLRVLSNWWDYSIATKVKTYRIVREENLPFTPLYLLPLGSFSLLASLLFRLKSMLSKQ